MKSIGRIEAWEEKYLQIPADSRRNTFFRGFVILKRIEKKVCLDPLLCGPSLEPGKEV